MGGRLFAQGLVPGLDQYIEGWGLDLDFVPTYDNMFRFKGRANPENPYSSTLDYGLTLRYGSNQWEWGFSFKAFQDVRGHFVSEGAEAVHVAMEQGFLNQTGAYHARVGGVSVIGAPGSVSVVTFSPSLKKIWPLPVGKLTAALTLRLPFSGLSFDQPGLSLGGTWSHWFAGDHFGVLTALALNAQALDPGAFASNPSEIQVNPVTWDAYLGFPMRFGWFWWSLGHRMSERRIWYTALPGQVLLAQITELSAGLGPRQGPWAFSVTFQEDVIGNYYHTDSDVSLSFRLSLALGARGP